MSAGTTGRAGVIPAAGGHSRTPPTIAVPQRRDRRPWAAAALILLLVLAAAGPLAAEARDGGAGGFALDLQLESLLRDGLDARGLSTRVGWSAGGVSVEVRADRIALPEPVGVVTAVRAVCDDLRLGQETVRCDAARIWGDAGDLQLQGAPVRLHWGRRSGVIEVAGDWPGWFGAHGDFRVRLDPERGPQLRTALADLDLAALAASPRIPVELPVQIAQGRADLALDWQPDGHSQARLQVQELAFSDAFGLRAGEDLDARLAVSGDAGGWEIEAALTAGVVFADPWLLDFDDAAVELLADGLRVDGAGGRWRARTLQLAMGTAASLQGEALAFAPEEGLDGAFTADIEALGAVYETLLSPLLVGTALGELDTAGRLRAEFALQGSEPRQARVEWSELVAEDRRGRFGIAGAVGALDWSAQRPGDPGWIGLQRAHLYGLPFEAFAARVRMLPLGVELLEPTEVPILDGGLRVGALRLEQTDNGPDLRFQGGIRAINLEPLTAVLGWPRFSGRIAGVIPRVRLEQGDLNVDGRLLMQVFDGEVVLRDVYIHDLFGYAPELGLSTQIERLDLELVTRAFDFGRIQGRLSGHVDDLVMVDWTPVHMNLELMTPREAPGRRRISQRAVENITELGGGLQAAASSIFLRVFENFSYRRLGFRCELRGQVCTASGVADRPDGGFVLVQGGGLPQIQVIGYNRRVDWPELIDRLANIQAGDGPVMQ
ncbi:hypothetical protein [Thioalkalivibrio sp. ALJT]|uniref:hypothetical protein n=1 Tax=Thioalkalivibrio sp. ALJT TaxID=1158146 RepID=UPI00035DBA21|nr:hypothetical protein [Thioalkalivibrio sp. ALJT]